MKKFKTLDLRSIKLSSEMQRKIINDLLQSENDSAWVGYEGSRRHKSALTLVKKLPKQLSVEWDERTKTKLNNGEPTRTISYNIVYKSNYEGSNE